MPIKKEYYSYQQITDMVTDISLQMYKDDWCPDYIVGLTRGGLVPAVIMSNQLDIPMHTLEVKLRDHTNTESNLWMAEDAFGQTVNHAEEDRKVMVHGTRKNILILDDINDTGATLDWIINDWKSSCLPNDPLWESVWGYNVRFAVLIDNLSSNFSREVNYSAKEINKAEDDVWIVYPWEK